MLCDLLAEDRPAAVEWPAAHLAAEARRRGLEAPDLRFAAPRPAPPGSGME